MQTLHLTVEPADAQSTAGEPVALTLTLRNTGRIRYKCHLSVSGLPREWYHLAEAVLVLAPGATAHRVLTLTPPIDAAVPVGQYPFRVQVTEPDDAAAPASAMVRLSVGLRHALRLEVQPEEIRGRQGTVAVRVINEMAWPATVLVGAAVKDEALRVRMDPAGPVIVPARSARAVALHVTRRGPEVAQTQVITVWGRQPGEEQASPPRLIAQVRVHDVVRGSGRAAPARRLPRWGPPVAVLTSLLLALAAAAGAATLRGLPAQRGPRGTSTPVLMRTVLAARVVRRPPTVPAAIAPTRVRLTAAAATPWPTVTPRPATPSQPTNVPQPHTTPRYVVTPTPTVFTITLS